MHDRAPETRLAPPVSAHGIAIQRPNRDKASSKATKATVILLLLVSAALIAIVMVGGWEVLQGAEIGAAAYVIVYPIMAFFVARWSRGVLPVAAALAILFGIIAAVAGPVWFERDKAGFEESLLPAEILGLLTLIIVPVQLLLIAFAMRGFSQGWNVEVEVRRDQPGDGYDEERYDHAPAADQATRMHEAPDDQATQVNRIPDHPDQPTRLSPEQTTRPHDLPPEQQGPQPPQQ